jgi:hypothetical protein
MSELRRVLKSGGILFISFKLGNGELERERYGHRVKQYLLSEQEVYKLLESEKLEVIEESKDETSGGFDVLDVFCQK